MKTTRRDFLKLLGIGCAAIGAASISPKTHTPPDDVSDDGAHIETRMQASVVCPGCGFVMCDAAPYGEKKRLVYCGNPRCAYHEVIYLAKSPSIYLSDTYYHDECPKCGVHTGYAASTYRYNMFLMDCVNCGARLVSDYFDTPDKPQGFYWVEAG